MDQQQQVAVGNQPANAIQPPPILQLPQEQEFPQQQQLIQVHSSSSSSTSSSATAPSPTSIATIATTSSSNSQILSQSGYTNKQAATQSDQKISFHLKTSIFTRRITIDSDKMALGLIKQLAIAFLNEIYFDNSYPDDTFIGGYIKKNLAGIENLNSLYNRLVLRKYLPEQDTLVPFNTVSDISQDSYICIEISERNPSQHAQSHMLINSGPVVSLSGKSSGNAGTLQSSTSSSTHQMIKMSHEFHSQTYLRPTHCSSCSTLIKGLRKQGFQCSFCKKNFCKECKIKTEATSEGCLAPITSLSASSTVSSSSNQTTPQTPTIVNHVMDMFSTINDGQTSSNNGDRLDPSNHANMSKRKSTSNLLHFNIANPFKSHHNNSSNNNNNNSQSSSQVHDKTTSKSIRGSAGALDPVLQQLSRQMRSQGEQQSGQSSQALGSSCQDSFDKALEEQTASDSPSGKLLNVQVTQLSSSHQNLFAMNDEETNQPEGTSCASANHSPSKSNIHQLSNSARTSARDILHVSSSSRRDQVSYHSFAPVESDGFPANETTCGVCKKSLSSKGHSSVCKTCKLQVHSHCQDLVLDNCLNRITESTRAAAERDVAANKDDRVDPKNNFNAPDNIRLHRLAPSVKHIKKPGATKSIIEGWLQHKTLSDEQTRKHYWRLDETDITLYENDTSARYFKAIALSKITRVLSSSSIPKRIKEDVALSSPKHDKQQTKSANASPTKNEELRAQMNAMFAFEVATGSVYLVQANDETDATRWKNFLEQVTKKTETIEVNQSETRNTAKDGKLQEIKPATTEIGTDAKLNEDKHPSRQQTQQRHHHHHHHHHHHPPSTYRGQHKTYTDPNRSRLYNRPRIVIQLNPMSVPDHWIEGKYLIEKDRNKGTGYEELGSGQFGKVYAAISEIKAEDTSKGLWSGIPVAIKEISKARFDLRQQANLKNEANILSRLDHPGVIILERVHDLQDKLYIVMEQLEDDMLEMIVSTEEKRLNERITKFLTYQILEALKYLHSQNIAHCDLKPENVLLVERRSQFPQIKLCDFGFAKIIEDNSFRSSLVGTPAYLAPEVVKGERYNRSVDLWSVGVIVYVSLSGEFPFNEGEEKNIHDQISRANFMYPDQPWSSVSAQAKNFINSLLRVNSDKRLSANRAQMDEWIQDYRLWCDLCELELRVGRRWVTDDADYERWTRFAKLKNLQVPRSAVLLHQQLQGE